MKRLGLLRWLLVGPLSFVLISGCPLSPPATNTAPQVSIAPVNSLPGTSPNAQLVATVTDDGLPRGSQLSFSWCEVSGPGTATFSDPTKQDTALSLDTAGDYLLSLTVSDGQLSTTASVAVTLDQVEAVPPDPNLFLTKPEVDTPAIATAYYAAVDPTNEKDNLDKWKTANGFDQQIAAFAVMPDTPNGCCFAASFFNGVDLGFGRRHAMATLNGNFSFYLTNYQSVDDAIDDANPIASVTMENSPAPGGGAPYIKFYVFQDRDGDGIQERVLQADLDGRGAKGIPALCVTCHGGTPKPLDAGGNYPDNGDISAHYIAYDAGGFEFSCRSGFSRSDLEPVLKDLNRGVLESSPTPAVQELIEGWYGGATLPNDTQNSDFVPTGWAGEENLYLDVIARSCRTCHATRTVPPSPLELNTLADFVTLIPLIDIDVNGATKIMPHALRTYDRFWLSTNPHEPDVLRQALVRLKP